MEPWGRFELPASSSLSLGTKDALYQLSHHGTQRHLCLSLNKICMVDAPTIRKRLPAIEKPIAEINPEKDVRVRILGTVLGVDSNTVVIDDGTGKVEVVFEEPQEYIKEGNLIRIISRILPLTEGFECRGECVQQLDGFDMKLYKRTREIIKRR